MLGLRSYLFTRRGMLSMIMRVFQSQQLKAGQVRETFSWSSLSPASTWKISSPVSVRIITLKAECTGAKIPNKLDPFLKGMKCLYPWPSHQCTTVHYPRAQSYSETDLLAAFYFTATGEELIKWIPSQNKLSNTCQQFLRYPSAQPIQSAGYENDWFVQQTLLLFHNVLDY